MKVFKSLLLLWSFLCVLTFEAQISVKAYVDHIIPLEDDSLGNITLNVTGGSPPYTYNWMPAGTVNKDLNNALKDLYSVEVTDASAHMVTYHYNLGYKALWASFYGASQQHDTLKNNGTYGWCGALSKNTFPAYTDMWFELVLGSGVTYQQIGVLDSAFSLISNDIDFGIYIDNNSIQKIMNGSTTSSTGYSPGDVFRLERTGNTINYVLNGNTIWSATSSDFPKKNWKLRAGIHNSSAPLVNVGCSTQELGNTNFASYIKVTPTIVHVSGKDLTDGSIVLKANEPVYESYIWQSGLIGDKINDQGPGVYTVLVRDYLNNTSSYNFQIGLKTKWTDFKGTVQSNDTLSSTDLYTWGSAISKNVLKANKDGWFDVVLKNTNPYEQLGFLDSAYLTNNNTDIDMGFYKFPGSIQRITNGVYHNLASWNEGDVLRIERQGTIVNYRLNGNVIWSDNNTSYPQKKWRIKAAVHISGGPITNIGCSFNSPVDGIVFKEHVNHSHQLNGSALISPSGGTPPYEILWKDSVNTNYRTDLIPGIYTVLISDSGAVDTISKTIAIGVKPNWLFNTNLSFIPDTLIRPNHDSLGLSISENNLNENEPGWMEIKANSLDDDIFIGFVGDDTDVLSQSTTYIEAFRSVNSELVYLLMSDAINNNLNYISHLLDLPPDYDKINIIRLNGGVLTILFRGSSDQDHFTYNIGDILKVGRDENGHLYLAKNDLVFYTRSTTVNNEYLYGNTGINSNMLFAKDVAIIKDHIFNPPIPPPDIYAIPKPKLDGGFYTAISGKIYFAIEGEYNIITVQCKIYDKTNTVVLTSGTTAMNTSVQNIGDNRYNMNVSMLPNGFYVLEVINEKKEKLYLRFKHYVNTGTGTGTSNSN